MRLAFSFRVGVGHLFEIITLKRIELFLHKLTNFFVKEVPPNFVKFIYQTWAIDVVFSSLKK